tara:strand:+ start:218 stop:475 length:258 start_codon:yes stop_codon:yes gene_type:complete
MTEFLRTFIISDRYLHGYTIKVDIRYIDNISDLEKNLKNSINQFINENNLIIIKENTIIENYHIHDVNFEEILTNNKNYYICNHN